ncbi:PEP-CTERM sorting domain-containing protein [Roseibacillus persicicus]|uniref:PEP-CTERM sorting domain-containing protein n=1 Tax=Roseibacillus persicicus TaxID=454148 RepID=UPI00398A63AB
MRTKTTLFAIGLSSSITLSGQDQQVLLDTMDFADYQVSQLDFGDFANPDDNSFVDGSGFYGAGESGNPGSYFQLLHYHDIIREIEDNPVGESFNTEVQSFAVNNDVSYIPTVDGPLGELTFSVDYRTTATEFFSMTFVIDNASQNTGRIYYVDDSQLIADGQWHTATFVGISDADTPHVSFSGADAIQFGFGIYSDAYVEYEPVELYFDFDNFQVTNVIPEPSTALLATLALGGLLGRRQRS